MKLHLLILSFCLVLFSTNSSAQTQGACAIGIKQTFKSEGSCSSDPDFDQATVCFYNYEQNRVNRNYFSIVIPKDSMNRIQTLSTDFFYKDSIGYSTKDGFIIDSLAIVANATDIKNDTRLTYFILGEDLKSGVIRNSASASDPCHNTVNAGGRESYTQTTTVYVDDPVDLSTDGPTRYSVTSDVLTLKTNDFYNNKLGEYELQVTMQSDNDWSNYSVIKKVNITPEGEIQLTYDKIAGRKSAVNTRYFDWLAKGLKFRVVKKLINGQYSFGKIVSNVVFFPEGIQYSIDHTRRTACSSDSIFIYVKLENITDTATLTGNGNVLWKARLGHDPADMEKAQYYFCTFEKAGDKYRIDMSPESGENLLKVKSEDSLIYGQLLLQEKYNVVNHCIQSFVIPPKPGYVSMDQLQEQFTVGEEQFDLLVASDPYAVINITDNYVFSEERMPYYIMNGADTLVVVDGKPVNFNTAEIDEAEFESAFQSECRPGRQWEGYLRAHYNKWFDTVKNGELYTGTMPEMSYPVIKPYFNTYPLLTVFSTGKLFYYYCPDFNSIDDEVQRVRFEYASYPFANFEYRSTQDLYATNGTKISVSGGNDGRLTYTTGTSSGSITLTDNGTYNVLGCSESEFFVKAPDGSYGVFSFAFNYTPKLSGASKVLFASEQTFVYVKNEEDGLFTSNINHTNAGAPYKISNVKVGAIKYLGSGYCIFSDTDNNNFKRKLIIEKVEDFLADGIDTASWHNGMKLMLDDFKAAFRKRWLLENYGYKLFGLDTNVPYQLKIVDSDGCSNGNVEVEIKMPVQPVMTYVIDKAPTTNCEKDGRVRVTYESNGVGAYCLNGDTTKILTLNGSLTVDSLAMQDTLLFYGYGNDLDGELLYEKVIDFSGPADLIVEVTDRTDKYNPNGKVDISLGGITAGKKVYTLSHNQDPSIVYVSDSIIANTYSFDSLPAGTYTVKVSFTDCPNGNLSKSNIYVESKVFSISVSTTSSNYFSSDGSFELTIHNGSNDKITWGGNASGIVTDEQSDFTKHTFSAPGGSYSLKGVMEIGGGSYVSDSLTFRLDVPSFDGVVSIDSYMQEGHAVADFELSLLNAIRLYGQALTLIKDGAEYYTGSAAIFKEALPSGYYKVMLDNGFEAIEIFDFEIQEQMLTSTASVEAPFCAEGSAKLHIDANGGFTNGTIQYGTDGISFNADTEFTGVEGDDFVYFVQSSISITDDSRKNTIDVNRTFTLPFSVAVVKPEEVSASLIASDITCAGLSNGSLSLKNMTGGNAGSTFLFQVDDKGWLNADSDELTNLIPGIYSVYLKDDTNACEEVSLGQFTLNEPDSLAVEKTTVIQPVCELSNGAISVEVEGGNKAYKYTWQYKGNEYLYSGEEFLNDSVTQLGDTLYSGQYILNVIDPFGCTLDTMLVLDQYVNPYLLSDSVSVMDASCFGDNNGEIHMEATGGSKEPDRLVLLYEGVRMDSVYAFSADFANLWPGSYSVELYDVNQCQSNQNYPITIRQPENQLSVVVDTIRPVLYKGGSTAYIRAAVTGGNHGSKNLVLKNTANNNGKDFEVLNNRSCNFKYLSQGMYWLEATDNKGCTVKSDTLNIDEPAEDLSFKITSLKDALCKARTGEFNVEGVGGWGAYTYKKGSDQNYFTHREFSGLDAGKYLLSVKDKMGAVFTDTVEIAAPQEYLELKVLNSRLPGCSNNGSLQLLASGGAAPYRLIFEDHTDSVEMGADNTYLYTGLSAGAYSLLTVDANGCIYSIDASLSDELMLRDLEFTADYPTEAGVNDGSLTASFEGGQSPFSYTWNKVGESAFNINSAGITNIANGFYQLTVQDATGCDIIGQTYLPGAYNLVLPIYEKGDETSYQASNGYVIFDFEASNFDQAEVLMPDGNLFTYTLDDVNTLFNGEGRLELDGLSGGGYSLYVRDSRGETYFSNFEIEEYPEFVFGKVTVSPALIRNVANGSATVSVKGGAPDYSFTWVNVVKNTAEQAITQGAATLLQNVNAGTYQLLVTDKYENEISTVIEILEPDTDLSISVADFRNESCKTYEDAFVQLSAGGGWGDYQFKHIDDAFYVNADQWNDLDVRTHKFYLIDRYGVTDSVSVDITEPDYLRSSVNAVDSVTCNGLADGAIHFNVSGGTEPYEFAFSSHPEEWILGTTSTGLAEGSYVCYFTDAHECVGQDTLEVYMPQPDVLEFALTDVTHTTCDTDNGAITVSMKGGSLPYRYEWWNADGQIIGNDSIINDLMQNVLYNLDVYDYHDCHLQYEKLINPSTVPVINNIVTTSVLCYGDSNGTAQITDVTAAKPYAPYGFFWSNGQEGEYSNGWENAMHHVTVRDTNQCESIQYFKIETPDSLRLSVNKLKDAHCYGYADGYIEVNPIGGVGGYELLWSNGDTGALADSLSQDEYRVLLSDANNCVFNQTFTVNEPDETLIDLGDDIKICPGNTITIDGQDYTAYHWSIAGGDIVSNERYFSTSEAREYILRVTNERGCYAYDTIAISIGNDALHADFLMSSEAYLGDTLIIYELSNLPLDSMKWNYDPVSFLTLSNESRPDYILYLETMQQGMFNVGLEAYSGGCVSTMIKQVEVFAAGTEREDLSDWGYQEPLIQSLKVAPNPSDGNFDVIIGLREEAGVKLDIYSVNAGAKVDEQNRSGQKEYTVQYRLSYLNTGMYLVVVTAEKERKQLKIIVE